MKEGPSVKRTELSQGELNAGPISPEGPQRSPAVPKHRCWDVEVYSSAVREERGREYIFGTVGQRQAGSRNHCCYTVTPLGQLTASGTGHPYLPSPLTRELPHLLPWHLPLVPKFAVTKPNPRLLGERKKENLSGK